MTNKCGSGPGMTYQTRKDLCWTGGWDAFALGWQVTVFEDVLYPWGILEVSVGLLEWRDGVISPQLCPELREDCRKGVGEQSVSGDSGDGRLTSHGGVDPANVCEEGHFGKFGSKILVFEGLVAWTP